MIFAAGVMQNAPGTKNECWGLTQHFVFGSKKQLQKVARCSRRNVLTSLVPSCANANSRKLSTKTWTEMVCFVMKRAHLMRTVSQFKSLHVRKDRALLHGGMLGVEGSNCSPLVKPFVVPFTSNERAREAMLAFEEAKVPSAMSYAEIR